MKKYFLISLFLVSAFAVFAQKNNTSKNRFILIVRFKADFTPPSQQALRNNMKAWKEYMANLGKTGKLVSGYHPGSEAAIVSSNKTSKPGPYISNGELVSSIMIINAADLKEAREIAGKCPALNFGGNVEVRSLSETAN